MLEIKVGDARCPSGAPVAILDGDEMLSCFPQIVDAVHALKIMERGLAIDNDVPGKLGHLTDPYAGDDDDPDDDDPDDNPDDMEDPDPDPNYRRQWVD